MFYKLSTIFRHKDSLDQLDDYLIMEDYIARLVANGTSFVACSLKNRGKQYIKVACAK